jgi:hypothetical protein
MNAQQILDSINGTQTEDPVAQQLAGVLLQYTQQFQAGQLSKEEYAELVRDLHTEQIINAGCADMVAKEQLNTICNAVLDAASMLSSI